MMEDKMEVERQLLGRYFAGECTEREMRNVEAWVAANPENGRVFEFMEKIWNAAEEPKTASDLDGMWAVIAQRAGLEEKPGRGAGRAGGAGRVLRWPFMPAPGFKRLLAYAAVLVIAVSVPYLVWRMSETFTGTDRYAGMTIEDVPRGSRSTLTLSDGTVVILDAGSRMYYPEDFGGETRRVVLEGEGFFEVASDAEKPFVVEAEHGAARVVGTKFNLSAWRAKSVRLMVTEGKVSFSALGDSATAVLVSAGYASLLKPGGLPSEPVEVDRAEHTGWMERRRSFTDVPLTDILEQLQRWYDVDFVLPDTSVAADRLTIHFDNQTVEEILNLISTLTELDYVMNNRSVTLFRRKSK